MSLLLAQLGPASDRSGVVLPLEGAAELGIATGSGVRRGVAVGLVGDGQIGPAAGTNATLEQPAIVVGGGGSGGPRAGNPLWHSKPLALPPTVRRGPAASLDACAELGTASGSRGEDEEAAHAEDEEALILALLLMIA